nr:nucleotidyltransferase domain-containing protein [uncultured Duganella sp.]
MDEMLTRRLVDVLRGQLPALLAVYVFGSRANGHAGPDGDRSPAYRRDDHRKAPG